jgi:hypothetical protein
VGRVEQEGQLAGFDAHRAITVEHGGGEGEVAVVEAFVEHDDAVPSWKRSLQRVRSRLKKRTTALRRASRPSCSRAMATRASKERRKSTGSTAA